MIGPPITFMKSSSSVCAKNVNGSGMIWYRAKELAQVIVNIEKDISCGYENNYHSSCLLLIAISVYIKFWIICQE